jgi:hypothetical protein
MGFRVDSRWLGGGAPIGHERENAMIDASLGALVGERVTLIR